MEPGMIGSFVVLYRRQGKRRAPIAIGGKRRAPIAIGGLSSSPQALFPPVSCQGACPISLAVTSYSVSVHTSILRCCYDESYGRSYGGALRLFDTTTKFSSVRVWRQGCLWKKTLEATHHSPRKKGTETEQGTDASLASSLLRAPYAGCGCGLFLAFLETREPRKHGMLLGRAFEIVKNGLFLAPLRPPYTIQTRQPRDYHVGWGGVRGGGGTRVGVRGRGRGARGRCVWVDGYYYWCWVSEE